MDVLDDEFRSVPERPSPLPSGSPEPRTIQSAHETDSHYIFKIRSSFIESVGSDIIFIQKPDEEC